MTTQRMIVALIVLVLATGLSHATVISYENSHNFASVGTTNISLTQFNPLLGTLNSVTMYVYGTGSATFAADNDYASSGIDATATMQHQFLVTAPGVSANGGGTYSNGQTLAEDTGDGLGVFDPSGPDGYNWGTVSVGEYSAPGSPYAVAAPVWAAYMGTGNVLVGLNSQVFVSAVTGIAPWYGPGTEFYLQNSVTNPNLNVRVRVDYDYTASNPEVPEPTTLALLGIGIFGVGMRARRRKAAA
jgi:hypothetical protein